MPKVEINPLQNLDNPNSAVSTINGNFDRIQAIIETLLSRDGRVPNSMLASLNMNEFRVLNLPVPVSPTEPARHGDIQQYVDQAEDFRDEAEEFRDETEGFRDEVEFWYNAFGAKYIGAHPTDPAVDNAGLPITVGAIYFNTTINNWRVFSVTDVHNEGDPVFAGDPPVVIGYWISFPQGSLLSQTDVDADAITNFQILQYQGGFFVPVDPTAELVTFDDSGTVIDGDTVQEAIEDIASRTSIGAFDIMCYAQDLLVENEQIFRLVATRTFWLPVNGGTSLAVARVAANDTQVISLRKNGTQFGTITFTSSDEGVWVQAAEEVFNVGDILSVDISGAADTALRDVSITFAARR